ncbi:MAG: tryptophan-rich sensory protein [Bryobacteraceae bacterium]
MAISVAIVGVQVWPVARVAALLLAPYLLWVLYAAYLSFTVFRLNARS